MNLFDQLVTVALKQQPDLSPLRVVVEKELLHHDILRILSQSNLLKDLTFIGGTCLRCCYGGVRLSEDLDFTGGSTFTRTKLDAMSNVLIQNLQNKYGLLVKVSEPVKDTGNVDTWKINIETRPKQKNLPSQRINIDVCSVPSYEKKPMLLLNPYGVDMGTSGLIIRAQSREEIYADKIIAFALRPNRIKHRDLWDITWLHQQKIQPAFKLIPHKLQDRNHKMTDFLKIYDERTSMLTQDAKFKVEFNHEMQRFLPAQKIASINMDDFWEFIAYLITDLGSQLHGLYGGIGFK